jgi:hypothetical protein
MLLMLKVATLTKSLSVPVLLSCDEGSDTHLRVVARKPLQGLRIDPRGLMSKLLHVLNV